MNAFEKAYHFFEHTEQLYFLGSPNFCELPYLHQIFKYILQMGRPASYHFYILDHRTSLPKNGTDIVVIYLSNEDHHIPPFINDVHCVFTPYPPFEEAPPNIFSIPLGHNGAIPENKITSIAERKLDLFFSGRYINTRSSFKKTIERLQITSSWQQLNTYIRFTQKFRSGLPPDQFAQKLADSKIALAPEGYFHSAITFRLFEAARAGCIPISKKLPATWYFKNFPGIQLTDWQQLPQYIQKLTKDPEVLIQLQNDVCNHYQQYFSEKSVAHFILRKLSE